jgi:CDGSH-type Zn-finger protein/uncharacterized Fe-S cluster protein YjdI
VSPPEEVRGARVVVHFDGSRCIHSRHCVLDRPDVFVPNVAGEWIHPDRATADEVAELAHNCPSGAIQYRRLDGGRDEAPPRVNTVRVREHGPLAFRADLDVAGHGRALRATLCRCGASQKKPFCDMSHVAAGFTATGEPATCASQSLAVRDGRVTVTPTANGPLVVDGNLEICAGTGRTIDRVTSTALFRCGHSANKPFCDGSHERVGFQAPGPAVSEP